MLWYKLQEVILNSSWSRLIYLMRLPKACLLLDQAWPLKGWEHKKNVGLKDSRHKSCEKMWEDIMVCQNGFVSSLPVEVGEQSSFMLVRVEDISHKSSQVQQIQSSQVTILQNTTLAVKLAPVCSLAAGIRHVFIPSFGWTEN